MNKNICVGIPHTGIFSWNTTSALLGLIIPNGWNVLYHMVGSCLVYDAREKIVQFAKDNKCKYVMMLDSDMTPPKDTLLKMVGLLEDKKEIDIVSGTIFKRTPPFQPCFYSTLEYNFDEQKPYLESPVEFPNEGLLPLAGVGLAGCLIRMSLFDRIDEKKTEKLKSYFFPLPNMGEDLTFCITARKLANCKIVCALSINIGHVASMVIEKEHFQACYEEFKSKENGQTLFVDEDGKEKIS